jgi:hypothetical protein
VHGLRTILGYFGFKCTTIACKAPTRPDSSTAHSKENLLVRHIYAVYNYSDGDERGLDENVVE